MTFSLYRFDLDSFVAAIFAEDLGEGRDITSDAVIPETARFQGVMDSRNAIVVAGLPHPVSHNSMTGRAVATTPSSA